MIPYSACMCFNKRGRPWTVVKSQRGNGVTLQVEDGWLSIKVVENCKDEVSSNDDRSVVRSRPAGLSRSEWCLLEASLTYDFLGGTSRFQTPQRRRQRARIPVMKPRALMSGLVDDSYNGVVKFMLESCGRWNFNTFHLDVATGGRSLSVLLFHLFQYYGFIDTFNLDVVKVWRCFNLIESCYHSSNPYHNSVHAADVTQAMHCFLRENKISSFMTPVELMSALLAAVTHDLDHPGVNQPFLIATSNHLASLYKNFSVLENHHWRMAISCIRECGIFDHLEEDIWIQIEGYIHSLILATDITRQQEFLSKFKRYLDSGLLKLEDPAYRQFILQIALKCADLCNPCRPWLISQRWSHQVCLEFFKQGDFEKKLNLPLTPICDRSKTSIAKIQADFFRFVVTPLFEIWHGFLASSLSSQLLGNLQHNQSCWDTKVAAMAVNQPNPEVKDNSACKNGCGTPENSPKTLRATVEIPPWSRRFSMPLSVPKLVPRTIFRRQSFPYTQGRVELAGHPLHRSPHMSLRTLSFEQLQPKTSILSLSSNSTAISLMGLFTLAQETERKLVHQPKSYPPFVSNRFARDIDLLEESDCLETPSEESKTLLLVDSVEARRRKSGSSESDCSNGGCSRVNAQNFVNSQERSGAQTDASKPSDPPSEVKSTDPTDSESSAPIECSALSDVSVDINNVSSEHSAHSRTRKPPLLREAPVVLDPSQNSPCHEKEPPELKFEEEFSSPDLFKDLTSWCSHVSRSLSEERPEPPSRDFDSPAPSWKSSSSSLSSGSRLVLRRGSAPVALSNQTANCNEAALNNGVGYRRRWSMASETTSGMKLDLEDVSPGICPPPFSIHPLGKELVRRHSFGILESLVGLASSESENDGSSTEPTSSGTTCSTRRNSTIVRQGRYDSRCTSIDQEGSCSSESHDTFPTCLQPSRHLLNRRRGSLPTDIPISLANRIPFSSGFSSKTDSGNWDSFVRTTRDINRRRASTGEVLSALVGGPAMAALQEIVTRSPSPEYDDNLFAAGYTRRSSGGSLEYLSGLWRSRTGDPYPAAKKTFNSVGLDSYDPVDLMSSRLRMPLMGHSFASIFGSFSERKQRRSSVPVDLALFNRSSGNSSSSGS